MTTHKTALILYKVMNTDDGELNNELKRLGKFIKTGSTLNHDIEYVSLTRITRRDVKGLIIIRGNRELVGKRKTTTSHNY